VGIEPTQPQFGYAPSLGTEQGGHTQKPRLKSAQIAQKPEGDPSVIADSPPPEVGGFSEVTPAYVTETLTSTRHKIAEAERQFWDLVIETTAPRKPRPDAQLVRPHLPMLQAPM